MPIPRLPSVLIGVLSIVACSLGSIVARPDGEALAEKYFASRVTLDLDETLSLYGDLFFEVTPRSQWSNRLAMIESKLGKPQKHSLSSWDVFVGSRGAGPGTYVTLIYDVVYSNYPAQETFRTFTPAWGWPTTIVGHHVDSPAFLPG